ncbi:hypothetical protein Aduo_007982 [Ancylostoma duodenale]
MLLLRFGPSRHGAHHPPGQDTTSPADYGHILKFNPLKRFINECRQQPSPVGELPDTVFKIVPDLVHADMVKHIHNL